MIHNELFWLHLRVIDLLSSRYAQARTHLDTTDHRHVVATGKRCLFGGNDFWIQRIQVNHFDSLLAVRAVPSSRGRQSRLRDLSSATFFEATKVVFEICGVCQVGVVDLLLDLFAVWAVFHPCFDAVSDEVIHTSIVDDRSTALIDQLVVPVWAVHGVAG